VHASKQSPLNSEVQDIQNIRIQQEHAARVVHTVETLMRGADCDTPLKMARKFHAVPEIMTSGMLITIL